MNTNRMACLLAALAGIAGAARAADGPPAAAPGAPEATQATQATQAVQAAPAQAAAPRAAAPAAARRAQPAQAAAGTGTGPQHDRVELDTTQITGNKELPNVMYVVPWKKPELGDFGGRPPRSLLDELLAPVDRDVFRRQNRYYAALEAAPGRASQGGQGAGAAASPAGDGTGVAPASKGMDEK